MIEAIELIRALWSGEAVTHHGAYYETRKAKLYTRSEHAVPLYISAMVPNSARVAGKYGDGLITVGAKLRRPIDKCSRTLTRARKKRA